MMFVKPTVISLLIICLLVVWGFAVYMLYQQHASHYMVLAVVVPALLVAAILYLQHDILPSRQLRNIALLAHKVKSHLNVGFEPIDMEDSPQEIKPLVTAINDLLGYFEDRYNQERDFTANASHELRTPLAGIRLQTEVAMKAKTAEQREKALKNIIKAVDRGARLVEQLLVLSRLTTDRVDVVTEAVSLGRVAARTVVDLMDAAERKQIILNMRHCDDCNIRALEDAIGIMINNFIRNAITYCPKGSRIDIDVQCRDGKVLLYVTDNGPGIPVKSRAHVMGRFHKAELGSKLGAGLGLAIVKRIVDLHGAILTLDSGDDGKGLKVTVIFEEYKEEKI